MTDFFTLSFQQQQEIKELISTLNRAITHDQPCLLIMGTETLSLRQQLMIYLQNQLKQIAHCEILNLTAQDKEFLHILVEKEKQNQLDKQERTVYLVAEIEQIPQALNHANLYRNLIESYRLRIILWTDEKIYKSLPFEAPDFFSYRTDSAFFRDEQLVHTKISETCLVPSKADQNITYYLQLLKSSKKKNKNIAAIHAALADAYADKSHYQNALQHYEYSLKIYIKFKDNKQRAKQLVNIGNIYYQKGELKQALKYYLQALNIHRKISPDIKRWIDID